MFLLSPRRQRYLYTHNRHTIVICQRLLRMCVMCVAFYQSSAGLQTAIASARNVKQPPEAATPAG